VNVLSSVRWVTVACMSSHAGQLTSGEHITLHVFLKAARLNGTILLRGMGWAESTDAVYYHDYHRECAHTPEAQSQHSCPLSFCSVQQQCNKLLTTPPAEQAA